MSLSPGDFIDLRRQATQFEELAAVATFRQVLSGDDEQPVQVTVAGVTTNLHALAVDLEVIGFALLLSFLTAWMFGMLPALRAARPMPAAALRTGTRTAGRRGNGLNRGVAVAEIALCFVLVVGSVLIFKTFSELRRADLGYQPAGVLTFTALSRGFAEQRAEVMRVLKEQLAALPGVEAVGAATPIPLDGSVMNMRWGVPAAADDPELFQQANVHFVLPGYFDTVRARLLAGRAHTESDNRADARTVVIDELLARKAFGSAAAAVGESLLFRTGETPELFQVVGVVAHQRHQGVAADGRETLFLTHGQDRYMAPARWLVRSSADPLALALIGAFTAIAVVLAIIGLYGVLTAMVRQRTAEVGVRMAFGASPLRIFRLVVGEGLLLGAVGVTAGVGGTRGEPAPGQGAAR